MKQTLYGEGGSVGTYGEEGFVGAYGDNGFVGGPMVRKDS